MLFHDQEKALVLLEEAQALHTKLGENMGMQIAEWHRKIIGPVETTEASPL